MYSQVKPPSGAGVEQEPSDKSLEEGASPQGTVDEEAQEEGEVIVPKDFFPHKVKEGDRCTVEVSKDYGDEVGLTYVSSPNNKEEDTQTEQPESDEAELERMATEENA